MKEKKIDLIYALYREIKKNIYDYCVKNKKQLITTHEVLIAISFVIGDIVTQSEDVKEK